ncbi:hypothetical protein HPT29_000075 [Microvirga terrae]|uniref:DUF6894 domain-containing protein n=1 Tax=Microvirga terrae TaxID=2740529 RepID=A0ABY5RTD4_9HYPH|nr:MULTISPECIES: hypothetical protein [Microvirga]MBQ0819853.1 hypothetical protein [Microvirga sp. HBU67558]UVF19596.1 hypothetical protein HPT29_000075 [Microvirga terrae]
MPRFFFHVRGAREGLSRDELGLNFPDVETAYREAFCAARDIRGVFALRGQHPCDYTIEVANAADELIFSLPFSTAFGRRMHRRTKRFRQ